MSRSIYHFSGRGNTKGLATPPRPDTNKDRRSLRQLRQVTLPKAPHEGLGISITASPHIFLTHWFREALNMLCQLSSLKSNLGNRRIGVGSFMYAPVIML